MFAAISIWNGHQFGRWLGIIMAGRERHRGTCCRSRRIRFWSLAIFAVDVMIIYGLADLRRPPPRGGLITDLVLARGRRLRPAAPSPFSRG